MHINGNHRKTSVAAGLCMFLVASQLNAQSVAPSTSETRLKEAALAIPHGSPVQVEMKDRRTGGCTT